MKIKTHIPFPQMLIILPPEPLPKEIPKVAHKNKQNIRHIRRQQNPIRGLDLVGIVRIPRPRSRLIPEALIRTMTELRMHCREDLRGGWRRRGHAEPVCVVVVVVAVVAVVVVGVSVDVACVKVVLVVNSSFFRVGRRSGDGGRKRQRRGGRGRWTRTAAGIRTRTRTATTTTKRVHLRDSREVRSSVAQTKRGFFLANTDDAAACRKHRRAWLGRVERHGRRHRPSSYSNS